MPSQASCWADPVSSLPVRASHDFLRAEQPEAKKKYYDSDADEAFHIFFPAAQVAPLCLLPRRTVRLQSVMP
jgi:hypothetical protein